MYCFVAQTAVSARLQDLDFLGDVYALFADLRMAGAFVLMHQLLKLIVELLYLRAYLKIFLLSNLYRVFMVHLSNR